MRGRAALVLASTGWTAEPPQVFLGGDGVEEAQAEDWLRELKQRFVLDVAYDTPQVPRRAHTTTLRGLS